MYTSYSNKLRKIAEFIERDNTPSDVSIGDQSIPMNDQNKGIGGIHKKKLIKEDKVRPTALPEQRRPRRQLNYKNKWNDDNKSEKMQQYMENYRNEGNDKEVDGPKSTYKKKLNVN